MSSTRLAAVWFALVGCLIAACGTESADGQGSDGSADTATTASTVGPTGEPTPTGPDAPTSDDPIEPPTHSIFDDLPTTSGSAGAVPPTAAVRLTITLVDGPGADPRKWELTCAPVGGTHPDPAGACAALLAAEEPFEPVPADAFCPEIYGGPQQAFVKGTRQGEQVNATFSRENGCEIARWDNVRGLFGIPILPTRG